MGLYRTVEHHRFPQYRPWNGLVLIDAWVLRVVEYTYFMWFCLELIQLINERSANGGDLLGSISVDIYGFEYFIPMGNCEMREMWTMVKMIERIPITIFLLILWCAISTISVALSNCNIRYFSFAFFSHSLLSFQRARTRIWLKCDIWFLFDFTVRKFKLIPK